MHGKLTVHEHYTAIAEKRKMELRQVFTLCILFNYMHNLLTNRQKCNTMYYRKECVVYDNLNETK